MQQMRDLVFLQYILIIVLLCTMFSAGKYLSTLLLFTRYRTEHSD